MPVRSCAIAYLSIEIITPPPHSSVRRQGQGMLITTSNRHSVAQSENVRRAGSLCCVSTPQLAICIISPSLNCSVLQDCHRESIPSIYGNRARQIRYRYGGSLIRGIPNPELAVSIFSESQDCSVPLEN